MDSDEFDTCPEDESPNLGPIHPDGFDTDNLIEDKNTMIEIRRLFRSDITACDFTLCLAIAAIHSLRVDQIFHPRPKSIQIDNHDDIVNLRKLCDNIPPLIKIIKQHAPPMNILRFLRWLFITVRQKGPHVVKSNIKEYPGYNPKIIQPTHVFNVIYTDQMENIWKCRKGTKKTFHAFHGSALENFFSILQIGLQYPMFDAKCRLYGDGVYLSTDLTMCFLYAPYWSSWSNSLLNGQYSVVACCEIIGDPDKVLCEGVSIRDELDTKIGQKYVVVTDTTLVRVSHLLVYEKPTNFMWVQKNIFFIVILFYMVLLLYVGVFGSQKQNWMKYLFAKYQLYGYQN